MQGLVPPRTDREFAALVLADDRWLRNEFEALIAASFGGPPAWPGPPAPPRTPSAGRPWRYSSSPHARAARRARAAGGTDRSLRRQRSPPRRAGPPVRVRQSHEQVGKQKEDSRQRDPAAEVSVGLPAICRTGGRPRRPPVFTCGR